MADTIESGRITCIIHRDGLDWHRHGEPRIRYVWNVKREE